MRNTFDVIIETPKGSTQKFDYDPKQKSFRLNKVMPSGMVFPFDFGFIPGTRGEDGDPLDVMVISEIQSFTGCVMECKIIGVINAKQKEPDGKQMRNDRYIAIPLVSTLFAEIENLRDFPKEILHQIETFFINYNNLAGKRFSILEHKQSKNALKQVEVAKQKPTDANQLVQILLPIYKTTGKKNSKKIYESLKSYFATKFGNLNIYTQIPLMAGLEKDRMVVFELKAEEIDESYWENVKEKLKRKFKEKEILIRIFPISVI